MAEDKAVASEQAAAALPGISINLASDGKPEIRTKVWDYLADNKLASFPWPPHKRIPNFKGAEDAGDKAKSLELFEKAQVLKIDPDKPLQQMRIHALEEKKTLLMPTPRLRYGFLNKIVPPEDADARMIKTCATRQGFDEYSTPIGVDDKLLVNLVVVGSVAVSMKGWRVGKGEGFSDLEYAIMASMGSVDASTPIVALVHDCQVLDLPEKIFGAHDVGVDYIVTPTRVIACENRPPKPAGLIWKLLNAEKLESIPILRKLRYRDWKAGKDVKLADETDAPTDLPDEELQMEDPKERRPRRSFRRFNRRRSQRRSDEEGEEEGAGDGERRRGKGDEEGGKVNGGGPRRSYRGDYRRGGGGGGGRGGGGSGRGARRGGSRFRGRESENDRGDTGDERDDKENRRGSSRGGGRRFYRTGRRPFNEFEGSVYVGSLPRSLRVSDFKGEVRDRKVNPLRVMWRGSSGFAFLNFKTKQEAEEALVALEGLHFDDRDLRLEMAKERQRGGGSGGRRRRQRGDSRSGEEEEDERD